MTKEKDENRIDRLERLAEEMFAGIAQLIFKYLKAPVGNPLPLPSSRAKRYPPVRRSNPLIMT